MRSQVVRVLDGTVRLRRDRGDTLPTWNEGSFGYALFVFS
jgi:hypothetical protein